MRPELMLAKQSVPRLADDKLRLYLQLLLKWQRAMNLVSEASLPHAWERHFMDSAQLAALIPDKAQILADLGSGAGFPGMVLAMMRPELQVHLIESDERKTQFLRTVSRETETPVIIHNGRIENMTAAFTPDVVTARALAPLSQLLDYCLIWGRENPNLSMLFLKGEKSEEEIKAAKARFRFNYNTLPSATKPEEEPAAKKKTKSKKKAKSTGVILRIHKLTPLV